MVGPALSRRAIRLANFIGPLGRNLSRLPQALGYVQMRAEMTVFWRSMQWHRVTNVRAQREAQALPGWGRVSFRNAVNPSMEAAGETSLFRTLRERPPPPEAHAVMDLWRS